MSRWIPDETIRFWLEQFVGIRLALITGAFMLVGVGLSAYAVVEMVRGWRWRRRYPDWPSAMVPVRVRRAGRWGLGLLTLAGAAGVLTWPWMTSYQRLDNLGVRPVGTVRVQPAAGGTWNIRFEPDVPSLAPIQRTGRGLRWFVVGAFIECAPAVRWILLPSLHRPLWIGFQKRASPLILTRDIEPMSEPFLDHTFRLLRWIGLCQTRVLASVPVEVRTGDLQVLATPRGYVLIKTGRRPGGRHEPRR
ncbi:MAG: hypothetical protein NZ742_03670 [Acidobacteria bacterium]|nr:hypothetical protein [Acidobacteriota bacterium]MDW7984026.1 hypothetical protein [Acidobacteriota bacterium]